MIKTSSYLSLLISLVFLCAIERTFAASNLQIANAVQSNGKITISGNGFDSHPDYSPSLPNTIAAAWDNLETGSFGSGGLTVRDYPENWRIISGGANRANSSYYASKFYNNGRLGAYAINPSGSGGLVYASFWFMMPAGTQSGKFYRVWAADRINSYFSSGGDNYAVRGYAENVGASTVWGSPDSFTANDWYRVDILNKAGGDTTVWINGKLQWTRQWFPSTSQFDGYTTNVGSMIDAGNGSYNFDDIYVNYSLARVEICDSATWNDSQMRHCEIQVPSSWSSSSIVVEANYGIFNTGDQAYLFVVDSSGNVSPAYAITLGGDDGQPGDQPPAVTITSPTTGGSYTIEISSQEVITIAGTASDDNAVDSVTYSTDNGQSGPAESVDGYTNWSLPVMINPDETVVATVTATDNAGQSTNANLTIIATSPGTDPGPEPGQLSWDATVQTGDARWKDSTPTYCVRLLIEGGHIGNAGNQAVLGFRGRTLAGGDYEIRNVSIAERDTSGNVGDVIDTTWTQVFFDDLAWSSNVTVTAGTEKLSKPVNLNLKPGTDYYVTFKIESPSVFLDPPAGYQELYFVSEDHTRDVDWSGNGHLTREDFHAFSKIYVFTPPSDTPVPATPVLETE